MRRLVVNADDFGFTSDVNEGILRSHLEGIVRSASLMANGAAFRHAVDIARRHPGLGVGCHLVLVQGESLARPGAELPSSVSAFLASFPSRHELLGEFRAQLDRLLGSGIRPTHLDTHKHLHLLPPVLDAVLRVAKEYGIGWIRKPLGETVGLRPGPRAAVSLAIRMLSIPFEERLGRASCRTADYFAGFATTGSLSARWLCAVLRSLPHGVGELVCHPGICGEELRQAATVLKESREVELRALCSSEVRRAVRAAGVELASYGSL